MKGELGVGRLCASLVCNEWVAPLHPVLVFTHPLTPYASLLTLPYPLPSLPPSLTPLVDPYGWYQNADDSITFHTYIDPTSLDHKITKHLSLKLGHTSKDASSAALAPAPRCATRSPAPALCGVVRTSILVAWYEFLSFLNW